MKTEIVSLPAGDMTNEEAAKLKMIIDTEKRLTATAYWKALSSEDRARGYFCLAHDMCLINMDELAEDYIIKAFYTCPHYGEGALQRDERSDKNLAEICKILRGFFGTNFWSLGGALTKE